VFVVGRPPHLSEMQRDADHAVFGPPHLSDMRHVSEMRQVSDGSRRCA